MKKRRKNRKNAWRNVSLPYKQERNKRTTKIEKDEILSVTCPLFLVTYKPFLAAIKQFKQSLVVFRNKKEGALNCNKKCREMDIRADFCFANVKQSNYQMCVKPNAAPIANLIQNNRTTCIS